MRLHLCLQLTKLRLISLEGTAVMAEKQEAALGSRHRAQQEAHAAASARAAMREAQGSPLPGAQGVIRYTAAEMRACRASPFARAPARLTGVPQELLK